jgi:hypothetical protein
MATVPSATRVVIRERDEAPETASPRIRRTPRTSATSTRTWLLRGASGVIVTAGVVAAVVKVHELGARWPRGMLGMLAVAAVGCVGVLAWLRVRGLIRRWA